MRTYRNFVFDLYGTLVDIHTDEDMPRLWRVMADMYRRYGAETTAQKLHSDFRRIEKEERDKVRKELSTDFPEIRLEEVFLRLLDEAEGHHACECPPDRSTWAGMTANVFRAVSIKRLRLFPQAKETLQALKSMGSNVYLLSNAQRIFTMPEIEELGLASCFDSIYISSDHGYCKPDPRFFEKLINTEHLDRDETVMIGNEPGSDMAVAKACGVDGILFDGYVSASHTRSQYRSILELAD